MASALTAALNRLSAESDALADAAWDNNRPAGPFTSAFLSDDLLVRDSDESERKPFRQLLDDANAEFYAGFPGARTRAQTRSVVPAPAPEPAPSHSLPQSRSGHHEAQPPPAPKPLADLMMPLRELKRVRNTPEELGATLTVLGDVIAALQGSFLLTRARAETNSLAVRHAHQQARIAELEERIVEMQHLGYAPLETAEEQRGEEEPEEAAASGSVPKLSIDDAIAAEEEALRTLEASLAPLRREHALRNAAARSPTTPKSPASPVAPRRTRTPVKTPSRTPRHAAPLPVVTNALVQTPARTPWRTGARGAVPGALGSSVVGGSSALGSSISHAPRQFAPSPRATMTPSRLAPLSLFNTPGLGGATPRQPRLGVTPGRGGRTPLFSARRPPVVEEPTPGPVTARAREAERAPAERTSPSPSPSPLPLPPAADAAHPPVPAERTPSPAPPPEPTTPKLEGVDLDHPSLPAAIAQLWARAELLMRTGATAPIERTPEATISHLAELSRRDPDTAAVPAVTNEMILLAHMLLIVLRAGAFTPETALQMDRVKAEIAALASARAWGTSASERDELGGRVVYRGVGFKVLRIDRRARGGPRVRFLAE